ncbi:MAG: 5'-3' exonuclease H3TH domain-containing protein, partial [Alphaproteobacteria bacterium]
MSAESPLKHLYLVDGSGFIFRAYHALPPMTRPDGTPVNAVYGFCNMLMKLLRETDADHLAVIFDASRETFRNDLYPQYKAHRPDTPEELVPQFPLIRAAVEAFNIPCIEMAGYEADDIIATYARLGVERGADVTIVSSDKDLMQLVGDRVTMFDAMKNKVIDRDGVIERFGVGPEKVIEVQALTGDPTDNVPGVPGIGVKTAALLIGEYGDLETLLARVGEIKQPKRRQSLIDHAEAARISHQLVRLKDDVPVAHGLDSLGKREPDRDALAAFLTEQGFRSIVTRLAPAQHAAAPAVAAAAPAAETVSSPEATADYELVQDIEALDRWIAAARTAGFVAIDTETTSLNALRADLVGVSLALAPGRACYIPLAHKAAGSGQGALDLGQTDAAAAVERPRQIALADALDRLQPLLEDPSVLKIGQNAKYDATVLSRYGIAMAPIDDTMLLSFVLDGGRHGHGMDELAELHLNHTTVKYKDVVGSG